MTPPYRLTFSPSGRVCDTYSCSINTGWIDDWMKNVTRDTKSNKGRRNPFGPRGSEIEMKLEKRRGPR